MPVLPLAIRIPALVVPVVEALGVKPLRTAWFPSMTVPEAPPTFRMPFPRLSLDMFLEMSLSRVAAPAI